MPSLQIDTDAPNAPPPSPAPEAPEDMPSSPKFRTKEAESAAGPSKKDRGTHLNTVSRHESS